jgi:hypothetical protein
VDLDDRSAVATDQVVMVAVAAGAIGRFTVRATDRIDLAVLFETTEVAVDRCKADLVEALVQLLRGQRALAFLQRLNDRRALNRRAAGARERIFRGGFVSGLSDNDSRFY